MNLPHPLRRAYCDHNATSPMPPTVAQAFAAASMIGGNPESIHAEGRAAKDAVEKARKAVAAIIGADPDEIVFTSGGTEADNVAVRTAAELRRSRNEGCSMVTSAIEHKAILEPAAALSIEGCPAAVVGVDAFGRIDVDDVERAIGERAPALVSIMLGNNEIGTIQPVQRIVRRIAAMAHERRTNPGSRILVHTDAVNALGKIPIDVHELGVDMASFSAHKIGGPKGIGALYVRKGTEIAPLLLGGAQEGGLRAGTPNVPGIVGFGAAARRMSALIPDGLPRRLRRARDAFERVLLGQLREGVEILGHDSRIPEGRLPNTAAIVFRGLKAPTVVEALDRHGIAVSAGSACGCKDAKPSHVLEAIGGPEEGAVRFSFGPETDTEDAAEIGWITIGIVESLRRGVLRAAG